MAPDFCPEQVRDQTTPYVVDICPDVPPWETLWRHGCEFNRDCFLAAMMNLVRNPNLNSNWLFRADILFDHEGGELQIPPPPMFLMPLPDIPVFKGLRRRRFMVRRLVPRNPGKDRPILQTCLIYDNQEDETAPSKTLVVYIPHVNYPHELPFYHPQVRGIGHLHEWDASLSPSGTVSVSFQFYPTLALAQSEAANPDRPGMLRTSRDRLLRVAASLLQTLHRHGNGHLTGYTKRVHHDVLVPQRASQDTYTLLKHRYARQLCGSWAESTDSNKHVFEDLAIAAFLIELWKDMYGPDPKTTFPGFVDIGCGNGLLVYLLGREGYKGWGFDARKRKSWTQYRRRIGDATSDKPLPEDDASQTAPEKLTLRQLVLLPAPIQEELLLPSDQDQDRAQQQQQKTTTIVPPTLVPLLHNGLFAPATFIISNHADELTPWTPILATLSRSPFVMIPCCSHDLTGARFRAPPPPSECPKPISCPTSAKPSTYASLVHYSTLVARACGFLPEREMLRIPSTRNACVVGRVRSVPAEEVDVKGVVRRFGGFEVDGEACVVNLERLMRGRGNSRGKRH